MANSDKDRAAAVLAGLILAFAVIVLACATSAAVGYAFGVVWGLLALSAWALLVAVAMARAVREIARDGKDG